MSKAWRASAWCGRRIYCVVARTRRAREEFRNGKFVLDQRFEDGHSAIEAHLTERLGDTGRKVHTGRSRNDQILVATRLWLKAKLASCSRCAASCAGLPRPRRTNRAAAARLHASAARGRLVDCDVVCGFAESFIDNAQRARDTLAWIDANPLGTAAGYGVNLPLDRESPRRPRLRAHAGVAGLRAVVARQVRDRRARCARHRAARSAPARLGSESVHDGRIRFVQLPPEYTTGSSIMPNKRNPDVIELMRATYASVAAARTEIEQLLSLPSGYQRDLQFSKGGFSTGSRADLPRSNCCPICSRACNGSACDACGDRAVDVRDRCRDRAGRSRRAVPRCLQARGAGAATRGSGRTPEASLARARSPGAAADLRLDELRARLQATRITMNMFAHRVFPNSDCRPGAAPCSRSAAACSRTTGVVRPQCARAGGFHRRVARRRARDRARLVRRGRGGPLARRHRCGGRTRSRQALAALGQTRMVALWQSLIDAPVAQVLLAHDDLRNRRRYLNARNTLLELLRLGSVPVVNENDTVAVEELKLGDNDNLAAIVAALVDADLLLIASDVDGLYSAHPLRDTGAASRNCRRRHAGDSRDGRRFPARSVPAACAPSSKPRRRRQTPASPRCCSTAAMPRPWACSHEARFAARISPRRGRAWPRASTGCAMRPVRAVRSASMRAPRAHCSAASRCCRAASSVWTASLRAAISSKSCPSTPLPRTVGRARTHAVQCRRGSASCRQAVARDRERSWVSATATPSCAATIWCRGSGRT